MIKHLWVWTLKEDVNNLICFCRKEGISRVFLSNKDANMVKAIQDAGIGCDFLLGLAYPFNANDIFNECKKAQKCGFDSMHLDLEGPDVNDVNNQMKLAINNLKLILGEQSDVDIQCGKTSDGYFEAINKCNAAYLMNYRQSAFGMYLFAKNCLSKIRIPFYIGFETGSGDGIDNISYGKLGKKALNKQIFWADLIFSLLYKNYKGVAIHYYETYSKLN